MLNLKNGAFLLGLLVGAALTALLGIFVFTLIQAARPVQQPVPQPTASSTVSPTTEPTETPTSAPTGQHATGYEIVRGTTLNGNGQTYRATAACPAGKIALGGGGSQGDYGWYVVDSAPADDGAGWYVEYSPSITGNPGPGIGEAWAICAYTGDGSTTPQGVIGLETVKGEAVNGNGGTFKATAACPAGKIALGGGGTQNDSGWFVDDNAPADDGAGWYVQYSPSITGDPGPGIGEAWAVCANAGDEHTATQGVSEVEFVRGPTVQGNGETYRSIAACPTGKKALGGGGSQGDFGWYVDDSAPTADGAGWYVEYSPSIDGAPGSGIGEAWAVCATVN